MFRSPLMSLRSLVGVVQPRRRSWDSALRSFAPACRWPGVPACPNPPAVAPNVHPDGFSSGDRPSVASVARSHRIDSQSRTFRVGSWALPLPASRATALSRSWQWPILPWAWPLSGLQTSAYGCVHATMDRHMNRQPPDTASGSFPLVGLVGQVNGMNGTVCCLRSLVRACRPFSVFQGLTPSRSCGAHCPAGPTPCLRFLHLP